MNNPNANDIYDRYVNLKHEHSLLQEEVERLRKHQAESIGLTREDWFRRIEEAVQHRDWKRRLFGKKSYYRKYKRQYGDRCRDCKWNPMLKKSLTAEHEKERREWIPAANPPKVSAEYIVMIEGAANPTTLLYSAGINRWFDEYDGETIYYRVSHWQELPAPPSTNISPKHFSREEK